MLIFYLTESRIPGKQAGNMPEGDCLDFVL